MNVRVRRRENLRGQIKQNNMPPWPLCKDTECFPSLKCSVTSIYPQSIYPFPTVCLPSKTKQVKSRHTFTFIL